MAGNALGGVYLINRLPMAQVIFDGVAKTSTLEASTATVYNNHNIFVHRCKVMVPIH